MEIIEKKGGMHSEGEVTVISYSRGNRVRAFDGKEGWYYMDGQPFDDSRPCVRCGRMPTPEGHDACLGTLPGVEHACCGHGVTKPYQIAVDAIRRAK